MRDEAAFARLKAIMSDDWGKTYPEWVENANKLLAAGKSRGLVFTKIEVDPDAFLAWCSINHRTPDSRARALYAAEHLNSGRGRNN